MTRTFHRDFHSSRRCHCEPTAGPPEAGGNLSPYDLRLLRRSLSACGGLLAMTRKGHEHRARLGYRRAIALILVLWAIAVLSLVAGGLSFAIRQNVAISNIEKSRMTSHHLARAGVERAIAEIMDDPKLSDTMSDFWYDDAAAFQEVELTGGTFSVTHEGYELVPVALYGAGDESAKLNVNVATREQLLKLPDMTESIASAIIDWRDENEEPEVEGVEGGYYDSLNHPYMIRNGPFKTVRELLLVRGVTAELFYGEDTNTNGLLDPNENDGELSDPIDNGDGRLDRGWFAYLTVYSYEKNVNGTGEKRVNLNKADANTLSQRLDLEKWAAESIVKAREKKDKKEFKHLVDLLDVKRDKDVSKKDSDDINVRSESEKDQPVTKEIFQRIVDDLSLKKDEFLPGRVNLNTAPLVVLTTLPGADEELASAIVRYRESMGGYTSIGDLLNVTGMTKEKFAKLEDSVTVRSYVFHIRSSGYASSGLATATIECVVERGSDVPRVLYWLESSP